MAARMKIAAAITACTRDEEMRNTMRRGTATMRVRVRPIGKFTLELRRRKCAWTLSIVAHDLVKLRHVSRHELRRVQTQARVDVGRPPRGDQPASPGRVVLEAGDVRAVATAGRQRVAGGLREH